MYLLYCRCLFDCVATKVLLGFAVPNVFSKYWIVLTETKFVGGVLRVFAGIVSSVSAFFGNHSNQYSLTFFCHNHPTLTD